MIRADYNGHMLFQSRPSQGSTTNLLEAGLVVLVVSLDSVDSAKPKLFPWLDA